MGTREYLNSISEHEILPDEKMRELVCLAQKGDINARNKLITSSMRLVIHIGRKYKFKEDFPDIIQEGSMGIMKAVERYDCRSGVKFTTYASWWMMSYMRRYLRRAYPEYEILSIKRYIDIMQEESRIESGHPLTIDEIAEMLDMTPEKINQVIQRSNLAKMESLDARLDSDDPKSISRKDA